MTDPIFDLVIADLRKREAQGAETYGKARMEAHDGRDALQDLFEELLDAAVYAKKAIVERDALRESLRLAQAHVETCDDAWLDAESESAGTPQWILHSRTGDTKHPTLRAAVDAYAAQKGKTIAQALAEVGEDEAE